jgi:hypothetical protein
LGKEGDCNDDCREYFLNLLHGVSSGCCTADLCSVTSAINTIIIRVFCQIPVH